MVGDNEFEPCDGLVPGAGLLRRSDDNRLLDRLSASWRPRLCAGGLGLGLDQLGSLFEFRLIDGRRSAAFHVQHHMAGRNYGGISGFAGRIADLFLGRLKQYSDAKGRPGMTATTISESGSADVPLSVAPLARSSPRGSAWLAFLPCREAKGAPLAGRSWRYQSRHRPARTPPAAGALSAALRPAVAPRRNAVGGA